MADNLNEESCLFDLLMKYNSGISNDINLFGKKRKKIDKVDNSKFELSMLTVDEIANHLKNLLPEFIIRFSSIDDKNVFHSTLNDLIFINERYLFKKNNITNIDGQLKYTLPIVILLLNVCWEHRREYSSNKIIKDFPISNFLRCDYFDEEATNMINEKSESEFRIVYLITGIKKKNNIFTRYLLTPNIENKNLLKVKLWNQPNFDKLKELIRKNIQKKIQINLMLS